MGTTISGVANCAGCHCMPDEEVNEVITASAAKQDSARSLNYKSIRSDQKERSSHKKRISLTDVIEKKQTAPPEIFDLDAKDEQLRETAPTTPNLVVK